MKNGISLREKRKQHSQSGSFQLSPTEPFALRLTIAYQLPVFGCRREDTNFVLQIINFDSPRGGISLVTEKGLVTTSRLLIQKAIPTDTGLYTCDPSNANTANVRVHILNGESGLSVRSACLLSFSTAGMSCIYFG